MTSTLNFSRSTVARFSRGAAVVHVRFAGEVLELPLASLDLGPASSDSQIKRAVATGLLIPLDRLEDHTVDRHSNGNLTVRPNDVFG